MEILFNCKNVKLSDWLNKYQFEKLTNTPVISFMEDITLFSDISSNNFHFSSEKTNDFLKKYNINLEVKNDNYIDSLLNQAKIIIF